MASYIENARAKARNILAKYGVKAAPIPVERIARALGIRVQYAPFDDELSGMAFIKDGTPMIGINSLHSSTRQRFTLAHEIAHIVLHKSKIESAVHVDKGILRRDAVSATGEDILEVEANNFAAELLMPGQILEAVLGDRVVDMEDEDAMKSFAKRFGVSSTAFQYRLRNNP